MFRPEFSENGVYIATIIRIITIEFNHLGRVDSRIIKRLVFRVFSSGLNFFSIISTDKTSGRFGEGYFFQLARKTSCQLCLHPKSLVSLCSTVFCILTWKCGWVALLEAWRVLFDWNRSKEQPFYRDRSNEFTRLHERNFVVQTGIPSFTHFYYFTEK